MNIRSQTRAVEERGGIVLSFTLKFKVQDPAMQLATYIDRVSSNSNVISAST